ncbi:MAG: hypothetical protein C0485_17030 [Pirellula sp.]|nr:hypothetical protein [Pirellula sp.]
MLREMHGSPQLSRPRLDSWQLTLREKHMPHNIGVKARWMKLSEALDASWSSLYDIGGALGKLLEMGFRASYFAESRTLEEQQELRASALRERNEEDAYNFNSIQTMLKALKSLLNSAQDTFSRAERELGEEVSAIPPEVLALLDALHGRPWRPHFRRFYLDSLRELPALVRSFDMAFYEDDCIPVSYRRTTIPTTLQDLMIKAELHPPFEHWHRLIRRAQIYAADLHAIRDEIGGELPDGPYLGFRWRHNGKVIDCKMVTRAWNLADFLWRKHGQAASYADCAEPVFGEREMYVDDDKIGYPRKFANKYFEAEGIPLIIRTKTGHALLESFN